MNNEMKKIYDKSIDFWNQALICSEADFAEVDKDNDWKDIGSTQLFNLIKDSTEGWDNVLDYGCGAGWADVILAMNGAKKVKAVDVAPNAVESAKLYFSAFSSEDVIDYEAVDVNWLAGVPDETYDCAICCNVLDVIPTEVAEDIIKNLARVCRPGSKVIITLNPFFTEEMRNRDGVTYEAPYMYIGGILRVNNHTDEEWTKLFSRHFTVSRLNHFKWDAEQKEGRRFYLLTK